MSGYTPAFTDMYMGTLYGRWPAAAVWATLIPLMDRHGRIDMSLQAIAGMTGWPFELLEQGIRQLMEPDPASRTPGEDGRRLVRIDESRPWGWIAVNHGKYREKARKQLHDERRQESGENAARMQARRDEVDPTRPDATRDDPRRPAMTRADPLSYSYSDSEQDRSNPSGFDRFWSAYPRKRKRKTAQEIWNRKRLEAKAEALLADIWERSKSDRRWLEGFIPDPTTYLNQERWDDELQQQAQRPRIVT